MIDPLTRLIHRGAGQHGPVMLMYHSVLPGKDTPLWPWAVSMSQFRAQLDFLAAEGWMTTTMSELAARPLAWGGRTVVITFDDGYADNMLACEELQRRGMRASWFVVTGSIGRSPQWPYDGRPSGRLLSGGELRAMRAAGMEIGSHTCGHVKLTEVSPATKKVELVSSKSELEDILGAPVTSFAYPYGAWDEASEDAVAQAGYLYACTTRTGWALRDGNALRLRRLTIFNTDNVGSLARKISLGSNDGSWRATAAYALRRIRAQAIRNRTSAR